MTKPTTNHELVQLRDKLRIEAVAAALVGKRNINGRTLESIRRQAQGIVREVHPCLASVTIDEMDCLDAWRVGFDGDIVAETWLRQNGFDGEADWEFGEPTIERT